MIEVLKAAKAIQQFFDEQRWDFAFIGGIAVNRWGRARTTNDADVCLFTDFGSEELFIDAVLSRFTSRIDDARGFAIANRVLLLAAPNGFGIDISLGAFDFERSAVARSSLFEFPGGVELRTVSAEDLVVFKAFAGRDQDWFDVDGILARQAPTIDISQVERDLAPLCELKGAPENLERLRRLWRNATAD
ncbi:MAG: hypothetical protein AAF596_06540 [Planctomycetota bacterium]